MAFSISFFKSGIKIVLPAHDFMRQEYSAHFWIFVLTFVDDCLKNMLTYESKLTFLWEIKLMHKSYVIPLMYNVTIFFSPHF